MNSFFKNTLNSIREKVLRHPNLSFVVMLGILLSVIVAAQTFRKPEPTEPITSKRILESQTFTVGTDPLFTTVPVEVRKESSFTVVALASGTVQNIFVSPGNTVRPNTVLLELSDDYGNNRRLIEQQIAENNTRLTEDIFSLEKKILSLEREIAEDNNTLSDDETEKQKKEVRRDKKSLEIELKNARLSLELAKTNTAVLRPRAFAGGTIERIFVRRGDIISPGMPLVALRSTNTNISLEASIPRSIAKQFNSQHASLLLLGEEKLPLLPTYFSKDAVSDTLFSIRYALSKEYADLVSNRETLRLSLPLISSNPDSLLIPLDSIFQDGTEASLFVLENDHAVKKDIHVSEVLGGAAVIQNTLPSRTKIILNRNAVAGDAITEVR